MDSDVQAAYILFAKFKWSPGDYYKKDIGERLVIRAFLSQYVDDLNEEIEDAKRRNEV